jgi:DNA-binding protein Fis
MGKRNRKINRPSAEELEKIMFENDGNFTKVGRMFGINDNSIRKWCKGYGLPTHSGDYKQ